MAKFPFQIPSTRREFMRQSASGIGLLAFSQMAPAFLTSRLQAETLKAERDKRILVLVQLAGGNDGLNTVVPHTDDHYHRLRPNLGLSGKEVLKVNDDLGFHPACKGLHELMNEGQLGVIQSVGYPNPNRSHFRSMEIWETASDSSEYLSEGWVGRYFDNTCSGSPGEDPVGVSMGNEFPDSFLSQQEHSIHCMSGRGNRSPSQDKGVQEALEDLGYASDSSAHYLQHTLLNQFVTESRVLGLLENYKEAVEYPRVPLARDLRSVAALVAAGIGTRVYYVSHGGFDTHANQLNRHQQLLKTLSDSLTAFQNDLIAHGLQDQVMVLTFSEFGRRPSENASAGTDHGTAAPLFVMGSQLEGVLHGSAPNLDLERNQDMQYTTDFRSVYQTVLSDWLKVDSQAILGKKFPALNFLKT